MQYMNNVYLLIGGNVGNRLQNLRHAVDQLSSWGTVVQHSSIYETAAWGKTEQPSFLNQALEYQTDLAPQALIRTILQIEEEMGRRRTEKFGPRIIDIDILFFNSEIVQEPHLTIPHPEIQNRRFALVPMAEIAPQLIHPLMHKTIRQLLQECPDTLDARKLEG